MQRAIAEASARLPEHVLAGWVVVTQLLSQVGIAICHRRMPGDDLAELDTVDGVLWIDVDAYAEDQMAVASAAWRYLTFGPHAAPDWKPAPLLYLVPPPRSSSDEQPA